MESTFYPSPAPLIYATRIECFTEVANEYEVFYVYVFESEADCKEAAEWACLRGEDLSLNFILSKFENSWRVGANLLVSDSFSEFGSGRERAKSFAQDL